MLQPFRTCEMDRLKCHPCLRRTTASQGLAALALVFPYLRTTVLLADGTQASREAHETREGRWGAAAGDAGPPPGSRAWPPSANDILVGPVVEHAASLAPSVPGTAHLR